ncbi:hypothetical protein [Nonomuraea africana]|uniref:Uncharacterized protein n=1 Tax=Nonomuraea africana TaxID=46171 RepID=A0ABR9KDD6_9ACTN|nr:hypothetical protein [Nonomuraea africana]MBE1560031.1 hypothetical protein [Nonomuraea africana]
MIETGGAQQPLDLGAKAERGAPDFDLHADVQPLQRISGWIHGLTGGYSGMCLSGRPAQPRLAVTPSGINPRPFSP